MARQLTERRQVDKAAEAFANLIVERGLKGALDVVGHRRMFRVRFGKKTYVFVFVLVERNPVIH